MNNDLENDVQRATITRECILVKYWRVDSIDPKTTELELKSIRTAIKQKYPTYPVDIEHHTAAADSTYDQDVDLHYKNTQFFSFKYRNLSSSLSKAPSNPPS